MRGKAERDGGSVRMAGCSGPRRADGSRRAAQRRRRPADACLAGRPVPRCRGTRRRAARRRVRRRVDRGVHDRRPLAKARSLRGRRRAAGARDRTGRTAVLARRRLRRGGRGGRRLDDRLRAEREGRCCAHSAPASGCARSYVPPGARSSSPGSCLRRCSSSSSTSSRPRRGSLSRSPPACCSSPPGRTGSAAASS